MAFTLLSQMEETRQHKEALIKKKGANWPLISAGIILLVLSISLVVLSAVGDAGPAQETSSSAADTTGSLVEYICAACFGIPALIFFLVGAVLKMNTNRQLEKAEQDYQRLRYQAINALEGK